MLEIELAKLQRSGDFLLPEYISRLSQLGRAARWRGGAVKSKRGPKGAGGNLAFSTYLWKVYCRGSGWVVVTGLSIEGRTELGQAP